MAVWRVDDRVAKRWRRGAALIALLAAVPCSRAGGESGTPKGGSIEADTVWAGTVAIERTVLVTAGARLTVAPGARLLFSDGTGLIVHGTLRAEGTAAEPVLFLPAADGPGAGRWNGITLAGTAGAMVLKGCVVSGAEAIRLEAGAPVLSGCTVKDGLTGISVEKGVSGKISGNRIINMTSSGVVCQTGATPVIDNNEIRACGGFGIDVKENAGPSIIGNGITGCDVGISYASPAPPSRGNRLEKNRIGIGVNNVGKGISLTGNGFAGNETGLWVQHFSSPRVEGNVFDNNGVGIFCYRSSSPEIVRNRIVRNRQGIVCRHLSDPRIATNELAGNGTGVFLTFSSYAVMNGNNFDNNAVQIELGVMSHEWEVKAGGKPTRGEAARRTEQGQRWGIPPPGGAPSSDTAVGPGVVDATGNWWGERDTAEMIAKGADANIGSLIDGRDIPPQKSEGYEGEFARDRIDYGRWKPKRIPAAGVPGS